MREERFEKVVKWKWMKGLNKEDNIISLFILAIFFFLSSLGMFVMKSNVIGIIGKEKGKDIISLLICFSSLIMLMYLFPRREVYWRKIR